ncbi:MAG: hypothetical protein K2F61_01695, partial [Muribaculaceae bacterium]|nr:hypothetical protein [Muribaculaceae bacterium]
MQKARKSDRPKEMHRTTSVCAAAVSALLLSAGINAANVTGAEAAENAPMATSSVDQNAKITVTGTIT